MSNTVETGVVTNDIYKLLEIGQYSLLGFWVALFFGAVLDAIANELDEDAPVWRIVIEISVHLVALSVVTYFIKKYIPMIPFCCSPNANYVPGQSGGVSAGITVGTGLIFTITQTKLKAKMIYLKDRIEAILPFGNNN